MRRGAIRAGSRTLLALVFVLLACAQTALASTPPHADIRSGEWPRSDRSFGWDGSHSYDEDGSVVAYAWDLDEDNEYDDASGPTASTTYSYPGYHTVRLRVTDDSGDSDTISNVTYVWAANLPPSASVDQGYYRTRPNRTVNLSSYGGDADGTIVSYAWDLDDDGEFDDSHSKQTSISFASPGRHPVVVRVEDNEGASAIGLSEVDVYADNFPPRASIDGAAIWRSPRAGRETSVRGWGSDDDGAVVALAWDLDDDGVFDDSVEHEPDVTFDTPGPHVVRLRVTDNDGGTATRLETVHVHDGNLPPVAEIDQPLRPRSGAPAQLYADTGDPDGYVRTIDWDLDDDGSFDDASGWSASPTYPSAGDHRVRVRVRDDEGASTVVGTRITTHDGNLAPVVSLGFTSRTDANGDVRAGRPVTFYGQGYDRDGWHVDGFQWDLDDDGEFDDATGTSTSRSFDHPGEYVVRVRAKDADGAYSTGTRRLRVVPATSPPVAVIRAWYSPPPRVGRVMTVSARDSFDPDEGVLTYAWDTDADGEFDDATGEDVSLRFATSGPRTVRLRVTDDDGESGVGSTEIDVSPVNRPPVATVSPYTQPYQPVVGQRVQFIGGGWDLDGGVSEYAWDLDDDGEFDDALGQYGTTRFATAGRHVVHFRLTDDEGATAVDSLTVTVAERDPEPGLEFSFGPRSPRTGATVGLYSNSWPDASVNWDLDDDGQFDDADGDNASVRFADPGLHRVRARAVGADGQTAVATHWITAHAGNLPPHAAFSVYPAVPTAGKQFTLNATATDVDGTVASFEWDLDDDGRYEDAGGSYTRTSFADAGDHSIRVRVTDDEGATSVTRRKISVAAQGAARQVSIRVSPAAPRTGQDAWLYATSSDVNGAVSYEWDLDDDGQFDDSDDGAAARVHFDSPGTRTVAVRVTDDEGGVTEASRDLDVHDGNLPPDADFVHFPNSLRAGASVTFIGTATDPDGAIAKWEWDVDDDGLFDDGGTDGAYWTASGPGDHVVRLRVTDDSGATFTATRTVSVHADNEAPQAVIDASDRTPATGDAVRLDAYASYDDERGYLEYAWDLDGDGAFDTGDSEATVVFSTPGTHTVRLRVADPSGEVDVATMDFDVQRENVPPQAAFTYSPASPRAGDEVRFESGSGDADGSVAVEGWDLDDDGGFDDASGSSAQTRFVAPGVYDVRLRVTDDEGLSDVVRRTVKVEPVPPIDPPVDPPVDPVVDPPVDPPVDPVVDRPGDPPVSDQSPAAPSAAGPTEQGSPPPPTPGHAGPAAVPLLRVVTHQRLRGVLAHGLALKLTCPSACRGTLELRSGSRGVGQRNVRLGAGERRTVVVRLRPAVLRGARHAGRLAITATARLASGRRLGPLRVVLR